MDIEIVEIDYSEESQETLIKKFGDAVELEYSKQNSTPTPPQRRHIQTLVVLLKRLYDITIRGKIQQQIFIDYLLKYIELLMSFLSSYEDTEYKKQTQYAITCLRFIPGIFKEVDFNNVFVEHATVQVLDLFMYGHFNLLSKNELLRMFNEIGGQAKKSVRIEVSSGIVYYMYKLLDCLSTHGDFVLQSDILETLFRIFGHQIKNNSYDLLPGSKDLGNALVTDISPLSFDIDVRSWLNKFNQDSPYIFSIPCKKVMFGADVCLPPEESGETWVDFNLKESILGFHCQSLRSSEAWNRLTIIAKDVTKVDVKRPLGASETIISMQLARSCISDDGETQNYYDSLEKHLKLIIGNEKKEKITKLKTFVLPQIFGETFSHTSARIGANPRNVYKPLPIKVSRNKSLSSDVSIRTLISQSKSDAAISSPVHIENEDVVPRATDDVVSVDSRDSLQLFPKYINVSVTSLPKSHLPSYHSGPSSDRASVITADNLNKFSTSKPTSSIKWEDEDIDKDRNKIESMVQDNIISSSHGDDETATSKLKILSGKCSGRSAYYQKLVDETTQFNHSEVFSCSPIKISELKTLHEISCELEASRVEDNLKENNNKFTKYSAVIQHEHMLDEDLLVENRIKISSFKENTSFRIGDLCQEERDTENKTLGSFHQVEHSVIHHKKEENVDPPDDRCDKINNIEYEVLLNNKDSIGLINTKGDFFTEDLSEDNTRKNKEPNGSQEVLRKCDSKDDFSRSGQVVLLEGDTSKNKELNGSRDILPKCHSEDVLCPSGQVVLLEDDTRKNKKLDGSQEVLQNCDSESAFSGPTKKVLIEGDKQKSKEHDGSQKALQNCDSEDDFSRLTEEVFFEGDTRNNKERDGLQEVLRNCDSEDVFSCLTEEVLFEGDARNNKEHDGLQEVLRNCDSEDVFSRTTQKDLIEGDKQKNTEHPSSQEVLQNCNSEDVFNRSTEKVLFEEDKRTKHDRSQEVLRNCDSEDVFSGATQVVLLKGDKRNNKEPYSSQEVLRNCDSKDVLSRSTQKVLIEGDKQKNKDRDGLQEVLRKCHLEDDFNRSGQVVLLGGDTRKNKELDGSQEILLKCDSEGVFCRPTQVVLLEEGPNTEEFTNSSLAVNIGFSENQFTEVHLDAKKKIESMDYKDKSNADKTDNTILEEVKEKPKRKKTRRTLIKSGNKIFQWQDVKRTQNVQDNVEENQISEFKNHEAKENNGIREETMDLKKISKNTHGSHESLSQESENPKQEILSPCRLKRKCEDLNEIVVLETPPKKNKQDKIESTDDFDRMLINDEIFNSTTLNKSKINTTVGNKSRKLYIPGNLSHLDEMPDITERTTPEISVSPVAVFKPKRAQSKAKEQPKLVKTSKTDVKASVKKTKKSPKDKTLVEPSKSLRKSLTKRGKGKEFLFSTTNFVSLEALFNQSCRNLGNDTIGGGFNQPMDIAVRSNPQYSPTNYSTCNKENTSPTLPNTINGSKSSLSPKKKIKILQDIVLQPGSKSPLDIDNGNGKRRKLDQKNALENIPLPTLSEDAVPKDTTAEAVLTEMVRLLKFILSLLERRNHSDSLQKLKALIKTAEQF